MDRQSLDACYSKGRQILARTGDRSLAHALFVECVHGDPGRLSYVEAFLDNLADSERSKSRKLVFSRCFAIRLASWKGNWSSVFQHGTKRLTLNPWHVPTLLILADSCEQSHFNEVELRYLKQALDADCHSEKVNVRCAKALARMGQFDQAVACWKRLEGSKRFGATARDMIYQLTIDKANTSRHQRDEADSPSQDEQPEPHALCSEDAAMVTSESPSTLSTDRGCYELKSHGSLSATAEMQDDDQDSAAREKRYRPGVLEASLTLVTVSLVLQLWPGAMEAIWKNIQIIVFVVNFLFVLGLIVLRQLRANRQ